MNFQDGTDHLFFLLNEALGKEVQEVYNFYYIGQVSICIRLFKTCSKIVILKYKVFQKLFPSPVHHIYIEIYKYKYNLCILYIITKTKNKLCMTL